MILIHGYALFNATGLEFSAFFISFLCLNLVGFFVGNAEKIKTLPLEKSIIIEGRWSTLVLMLTLFSTKFFFGFLKATNPALASKYSPIPFAISGLITGFLLGKAIAYTVKFFSDRSENH